MKKILFVLLAVMSATTMVAMEKPTTSPNDTIQATTTDYLWNDGKDFYVGRTLLTPQECENLLKNICPIAFRQYDKGKKLIAAGWSTFGIGLALIATMWVPDTFNNPYEWGDSRRDNFSRFRDIAMQVWCATGLAATASSIPMLCVGYTSRNRTANTYNYHCMNKEPDIRYTITANRNGLGFAVNF